MKDLILKILKESENEFDWIESPFGIDDNLMNYLTQNYRVGEYNDTAKEFLGDKYVMVDDKMYPLEGHKKQLTNKIYWEVVDEFPNMNQPVLRRTIKTFLNNIVGN
jgi:hypothetical protein